MSEDLVKVAVRIRPLIQTEKDKGCQTCLNVVPGEQQVQVTSTEKSFTFNYVFPADSSQEEFYDTAIKKMVSNIFEGYNVTILAYGQTGSGKTYSMGTNYVENDVNCGVIPRAVNDIFEQIKSKDDWDFKVTVAFMELYKEQLYDLLAKKPRNQCIVDIREDIRGVKVVGLSEIPVNTTQETLQCLADGSANRATGATAMNVQSSRSHAIFTISVHQKKKNEPNSARFAKFHLVDLAGSERSKKTQATGERFKEGVNINKGLLALGNVISQLGENGNSSYIGYRDSKLTRLLQDSLGGNSVTLMIACVSPADYNLDESTSTLRYADRAKKIKNKPIINQDPQIAEINNLKKIIRELQSAMKGGQVVGDGNLCPPEHLELADKNALMQRKIKSLTETLNANLTEIVHMHELADLAEQSREQIKLLIATVLEDCENLLKQFDENPNDIEGHKSKLEKICLKILNIQKEQQKSLNELITHEMSVDSAKDTSVNSEIMSNSIEEYSLQNETYDIDEKHEEHTLQQAERVDEVQYINRQLAIKEDLVSKLQKESSEMVEHQKDLENMEQEIQKLQTEKEELMQALRNAQTCNNSAKIAETRRKKVQELEKKIAELSRKCLEQNKIIKSKEKSDVQIKNLHNEIVSLKQTKVKLIRNMRSETDKFNKWKKSKEQEFMRLKSQDRKRLAQMTKLKSENEKQKNTFRRKLEESQAIQKRLKNALDSQKKASQRREKTNSADIQNWVQQELELLQSTVQARFSLQKLKEDKAYSAAQLAELELQNDSANQNKIAELMDIVETRNTQIKNLEKDIEESDQENRSKIRYNYLSTMADCKEALKSLFDINATCSTDNFFLKSKLNDVLEEKEDMKLQLLKHELRESTSKKRKEYYGLPIVSDTNDLNETEKDEMKKQIEDLKKQIAQYQEQIQDLQDKVLTEKDTNIVESKLRSKPKPKILEAVADYDGDSFMSTDESYIDDDENDPDWRKTPLYNRIQKLENTTRNIARESKAGMKRSSNGEIKCHCKTQCSSRLCKCRKNDKSCENCNCNPDTCQNRDGENARRTLFTDCKESVNTNDLEFKKPKLEVET